MKQIEVKLFVKNKKKPIATAILSSDSQLESLKEKINDVNEFLDFYRIIVKKEDLSYIEINEK